MSGPTSQVNNKHNIDCEIESEENSPTKLATPSNIPFARGSGISPVRSTAPSMHKKMQQQSNKKFNDYDDETVEDNDEEVAELDVIPNKNKSKDRKDNNKYEVNSCSSLRRLTSYYHIHIYWQ